MAEEAAATLRSVLENQDATTARDQAINAAAKALELAAWLEDPREDCRLALLRRLEEAVDSHESSALRAEDGYRVSTGGIDRAAQSTTTGLQDLDTRTAQKGLIELAALGVRASINLERFGQASGPGEDPPRAWQRHVTRVAWDVAMAADDIDAEDPGSRWLRLIAERAPSDALAQADDPDRDRCLQAEALLECRRAWLQRAAGQLALWDAVTPFATCSASTLSRLSQGAVALLRATDLARRPQAFQQREAWAADHARLVSALQAHLDRPDTGWRSADPRARMRLMANTTRAIVATALIDGRLGDRDL